MIPVYSTCDVKASACGATLVGLTSPGEPIDQLLVPASVPQHAVMYSPVRGTAQGKGLVLPTRESSPLRGPYNRK